MKKLKCYIDLPFMNEWRRNRKITCIPIGAGITFSWSNYDFELCREKGRYPKGKKEGTHKFTISIGVFYWGMSLVFYYPKSN